jgi:wyosine [tRNA(Phe)-imidazoG37] synthetase (radical SAM superfamily)
MKLDCGTEQGFKKINRPCSGVEFEKVVDGLSKLNDFILQTVLVDGSSSNSDDEEIGKWMEQVGRIKPREVQIYSIDRPSADSGLILVSKERLRQIAQKAQEVCGIPVGAF